MTRRLSSLGVHSLIHRTRWDLPVPESPITGMSNTPLAAGRVKKSRRTACSSTGVPISAAWPACTWARKIRSGACVAKNTDVDGLTASVLMRVAASTGSQHRNRLNSTIEALPHGNVGDAPGAACNIGVDGEDIARRVGGLLQLNPTAVGGAEQRKRQRRRQAIRLGEAEVAAVGASGQHRYLSQHRGCHLMAVDLLADGPPLADGAADGARAIRDDPPPLRS